MNRGMTPEEEMAVIVPDAMTYKGVKFDLPKPVNDYVIELIEDRHRLRQDLDRLHAQHVASLDPPDPPESPWVRVDKPW